MLWLLQVLPVGQALKGNIPILFSCPVFPLGLSLLHVAQRFGMPTLAQTQEEFCAQAVPEQLRGWVLSLRSSGVVHPGISSAGKAEPEMKVVPGFPEWEVLWRKKFPEF